MRQRLITAFFGLSFAVIVLFFYNTIIFNIVVALFSLGALYEILITTKMVKNISLFVICSVYGVAVSFFHVRYFEALSSILCYLFIVSLFIFLLFNHKTMRFEIIGTVFLFTLLISFSISCLIFVRDLYQNSKNINEGLFYICIILIGAWATDAGGYFIGRFFGKHKLSPQISPKKTVEGAVGGFTFTVLFFLIAIIIYNAYCSSKNVIINVNYINLFIAAILSSAAAILGDLAASLIKRDCNIKDFGNIMPGHGGILDRFDSVMLVAPLIYLLLQFIPIIK